MNIFFLGAGFSQPADLPLGDTLFSEVLKAAKSLELYKGDLLELIVLEDGLLLKPTKDISAKESKDIEKEQKK